MTKKVRKITDWHRVKAKVNGNVITFDKPIVLKKDTEFQIQMTVNADGTTADVVVEKRRAP